MSAVKERIFGAVTVMSEKDAQKVWEMIRASFILANAETVEPEPDEISALEAYHRGNPDYQPYVSQEELMKQLGL